LNCNESYAGSYYRDCDATINYEVTTDYSGDSCLDVEVECSMEIEYKGRQTYTTQTDSASQDASHTLYAHAGDSESIDFNFSFTSYKEITIVTISSAQCEIDSVDLY